MAAVEATDADQDEPKKKKKSSGSLLQMIILVLLLVLLALGGFIAWKLVTLKVPLLSGHAPAAASADAMPKPGIFIAMDNITVNLADTDQSRFLRVKMKLEARDKDAEKRIKANNAQIKDLVITILSSKTFDDVRTPQGKFALKEELAYRINQLVGGHPVNDVYFTDFVAQ
jgi:flagellar FliL protein